jgi:hypothetical protein
VEGSGEFEIAETPLTDWVVGVVGWVVGWWLTARTLILKYSVALQGGFACGDHETPPSHCLFALAFHDEF